MTIIPELNGTYPWWCWGAVDFVAERIQSDWRVFEWGSGGSTLWFGQRAGSVVTVEHDPNWCAKTRTELGQYGIDNVLLVCEDYLPVYACEIYDYDPFDLVSVDGRSRCHCLQQSPDKVKPGGYLVLDNSERAEYQDAMRILAGWERHDFNKPDGEPGYREWRTTIWRKPE